MLSALAVFYSIAEIISFCCFTENKGIFCCHGSGIYRLWWCKDIKILSSQTCLNYAERQGGRQDVNSEQSQDRKARLNEKGEIKKNKTRHLMRIGYLRTRHCSCANTQFSIRKNTGQYTGDPIAVRYLDKVNSTDFAK